MRKPRLSEYKLGIVKSAISYYARMESDPESDDDELEEAVVMRAVLEWALEQMGGNKK